MNHSPRHQSSGLLAAMLALFLVPVPAPAQLASPASVRAWLQQRSTQQSATAKRYTAFHDFQFADRFSESGIRFTHQAVEDCNKFFKPAHYDHGTAVTVADVDGDGRLDVYFTSQLGSNELWRNLGGGKFENITAAAGVGMMNRISVGAAFADIDNDGDPDLFVTTVRHGNALFENVGQGRFRDITQEAGVGYIGHSSGAFFCDVDRDGLADLFVCNVGRYTTEAQGPGGYYLGLTNAFEGHLHSDRAELSLLYRNLGGRKFREVAKEMNLQELSWSGDASFADLNDDGYPDFYVLNMQGDDHFYENEQGRRFVDKTSSYFPKTPWGAMGLKFFDFNQDGRLDLFITDMHSDMSDPQLKVGQTNVVLGFEKQKSEAWCTEGWSETFLQGSSNNIFGNALYLNQGQKRFSEISERSGAETFWPWGFSVGDLNADGYEDAFVTSGMGYFFRYAINSLLLNERGETFFDSEFLLGIEPRQNARTDKPAFTLDCMRADKDHPLCEGQSGRVRFRETLSTRSSAIFDLDDDGDLDIVTNEMNDRPQVLVSNLTGKKPLHFLKVSLTGTRSNRDGLGAVISVQAGGKTFTQQLDGKSGYLAQASIPLYFGLGSADKVDQVMISWPSGTKQTLTTNLTLNTVLRVTEPR